MNTIIWQIILQFILIGLNAVFASAEIAVISINDAKLERMAAEGNKKAKRLAKLTAQPARFLATIQVAITLSGFLGSAFAADNFAGILSSWLASFNLPIAESTLNTISVVAITLLLSYFTLIFGELVPKRVAMKNAEALALGLSTPITGLAKIFAPIVWFLTISTNALLRLMHIDPDGDDDNVTEEEIRMMVDVGSEKGTIDAEEQEMIRNVFEFDDISADEIATHRTEVDILWMEESPEEWQKTIHESRHSIYPVCDESVDNVVGILNAKDYFPIEEKTKENILKEAVKPPYFIPETLKANILFKNMKNSGNYFAIVIDEYGGMTGIVTMNDLVKQLVGEFDDESDPTEKDMEQIDPITWKICGNVSLEKVERTLNITLHTDGDYETFGGYIFEKHGSIPKDGSTFQVETENLTIKVIEIREHKIISAIVVIREEDNGEEEE